VNPLLAVVVAVALSLLPVLCYDRFVPRFGDRYGTGAVDSAILLSVLLATGLLTVQFAPWAPEIQWGIPDATGLVLVLATSPGLWVIGAAVAIAMHAVGLSPDTETDGLEGPLWPYLVVALVLVGPAEDLLFRGIVQPLLVDAIGLVPGLLAMAGLFGLYHYPNSVESLSDVDGNALQEMTLSGAGGLVLGVLYVATGNLVVPIAGHALHDAGLFVYMSRQAAPDTDEQDGTATAETA
jgi:membrane protease YdiL (CAAX protease family)